MVGLDTLVKLAMIVLVPLVAWVLTEILDMKDQFADLRSDMRVVSMRVETVDKLHDRISDEGERITTLGQRYSDIATRLAIIESRDGGSR